MHPTGTVDHDACQNLDDDTMCGTQLIVGEQSDESDAHRDSKRASGHDRRSPRRATRPFSLRISEDFARTPIRFVAHLTHISTAPGIAVYHTHGSCPERPER